MMSEIEKKLQPLLQCDAWTKEETIGLLTFLHALISIIEHSRFDDLQYEAFHDELPF